MHRKAIAAKGAVFLLLLCAVVWAQVISFASEHSHQHSTQHCCGLCHTGPLPWIQTDLTAVEPEQPTVWLEPANAGDRPRDVAPVAQQSRAPPTSLSV